MNQLLTKTTIVIVGFFFLFGCAGSRILQPGERKLIEIEGPIEFKTDPPNNGHIGISAPCSTKQCAVNNAILDARKKIINELKLEIYVDKEFERLLIEDQTGIIISRDLVDIKVRIISKGILSIKPENDYYIETYKIQTEKGVKFEHEARCFIRYSHDEHQRIIRMMITTFLKEAKSVIENAENDRIQGKIKDALRSIRPVFEWISEMKEYPAIPFSEQNRLNAVLKQAENVLNSIKILIVINELSDNEQIYPGEFAPRLVKAMIQNKLSAFQSDINWSKIDWKKIVNNLKLQRTIANSKKADLILVGIAEAIIEKKWEGHGLYSASLEAKLKIIDPVSGNSLWAGTIPSQLINAETVFDTDTEGAARKALSLAGNNDDPLIRLADEILKNLME
ncbi:MAG: hypothetical protein P9X24_05175 [Candidatus Hatepunaea meridiana]|nr:hypothetical protein [Candidatus Hatepunaea meridiana]